MFVSRLGSAVTSLRIDGRHRLVFSQLSYTLHNNVFFTLEGIPGGGDINSQVIHFRFFLSKTRHWKKQLTAIQHDKVCQERSGANLMLIAVYFKLANSVKSSDKNLSQSIRQMFKLTQFAGLCSSQWPFGLWYFNLFFPIRLTVGQVK